MSDKPKTIVSDSVSYDKEIIGNESYTTTVSFGAGSTASTCVFKFSNSAAVQIRIKTSTTAKLTFTYYYKDLTQTDSDPWLSYSVKNQNCGILTGFGIAISPSSYPYGYFVFEKPENVSSFELTVSMSPFWR